MGFAFLVTFFSPVQAISLGETVNFHVSADPDVYDHANADALLSYYQVGSDQYMRVDVCWGKASLGGAMMYFEIGKEFTIVETDHPSPEHHITVSWHPWWAQGVPILGEGSRIVDLGGPGVYYKSYYFIARRVDYSSSEVWAELMVMCVGEMGSLDIDYDWQSLSLPVPVCAMKTRTDGYFYVPNVATDSVRIEMLFDNRNITGDQTGGTSPYSSIQNYPDGKVDMINDIKFISGKFGVNEGASGWDYMADVVPSRRIDIFDTRAAAINFGKSGTYINSTNPQWLSGVSVVFSTGEEKSPDSDGFVTIPQGATSFTVKRNSTPIGAMIIFWEL